MRVRAYGEESENISVDPGVKQGDVLSPILFNYVIDWIMERVVSTYEGVTVGNGVQVSSLRLC